MTQRPRNVWSLLISTGWLLLAALVSVTLALYVLSVTGSFQGTADDPPSFQPANELPGAPGPDNTITTPPPLPPARTTQPEDA